MTLAGDLSRRNFIAVGGVALLGVPAKAFSLQQPSYDSGAAGRSLAVVRASDDAFTAQMDASFPGLRNDSDFKFVAPLVALVTNIDGPPVKAMSLKWSIATPENTHQETLFYY